MQRPNIARMLRVVGGWFGHGYYVKGNQGGVNCFTPHYRDAMEWLGCGFSGETVTVYRSLGRNFVFVASLTAYRGTRWERPVSCKACKVAR